MRKAIDTKSGNILVEGGGLGRERIEVGVEVSQSQARSRDEETPYSRYSIRKKHPRRVR